MVLERGGFLLFLVLVTAALVWIVWPFAAPLLWASLAAIMFQPLYQRILGWCGGRRNIAAILSLLVITVSVIIPTVIIATIVVEEVVGAFYAIRAGDVDIAAWLDQIMTALPDSVQASLAEWGWGDLAALRQRAQELAERSAGMIASQAVSIGSGVLGWMLALAIGLYATFFLLRDGKDLARTILQAVPLSADIATIMSKRFLSIVRATIKGTVVVGLVQGSLGGITFLLAGLPSPILFAVVMTILSLLPAVGPALVWVPAAIYLLAVGEIWPALFVVFSGVAIIGLADNVLRPILVGRDTGIPDWIILVTTLGGLALFGLSGIVLGPVIAGLFLSGWAALAEQRAREA